MTNLASVTLFEGERGGAINSLSTIDDQPSFFGK